MARVKLDVRRIALAVKEAQAAWRDLEQHIGAEEELGGYEFGDSDTDEQLHELGELLSMIDENLRTALKFANRFNTLNKRHTRR